MADRSNAQASGGRKILESLDREFARLHAKSCAAIEQTPVEILYAIPALAESVPSNPETKHFGSVAENLLRSAAAVEQTFGGITTNLWDDPFEWTLPEYLSTADRIKEYLVEVEATRKRAFCSFTDDACLLKRIAVPSGETRTLIDLLLETLLRAVDLQGRALFMLNALSGIGAAGFII